MSEDDGRTTVNAESPEEVNFYGDTPRHYWTPNDDNCINGSLHTFVAIGDTLKVGVCIVCHYPDRRGVLQLIKEQGERTSEAVYQEMREQLDHQRERHMAELKRATDRAYSDGLERGQRESLLLVEAWQRHWDSVHAPEQSPMMNEAQAPIPPSPSTPQAAHKCARAMMIVHNDGTETMVSFDNKIAQRGWKFRNLNGVPMLVVGHGVPRRHIPLNNVKFMDLLTEDEL